MTQQIFTKIFYVKVLVIKRSKRQQKKHKKWEEYSWLHLLIANHLWCSFSLSAVHTAILVSKNYILNEIANIRAFAKWNFSVKCSNFFKYTTIWKYMVPNHTLKNTYIMHRILWHILTGEEVEDLGLKLKGPSSKRFSYSGSIIHTCQVICFKKV